MGNTSSNFQNTVKHIHILFLGLMLLLTYSGTALSEIELIWDGRTGPESKHLFFTHPDADDQRLVKKPKISKAFERSADARSSTKTPKAIISHNGINMIKVFGGCTVSNEKDFSFDSLLNEECVDDFYLSDSEITNAQYNKFLLDTGKDINTKSLANIPVVNVSWQNAVEFTQWMSKKYHKKYTLPSAIQWKYAASANKNHHTDVCAQANLKTCNNQTKSKIIPVKSLESNQWGFYDMFGNVWEWVDNGEAHKKIAKGGSWKSDLSLVSLNDEHIPVPGKLDDVGFRVVLVR